MVKITVSPNCTGCETCVNNCPASVYEIKNGKSVPVRVEDCILCRTCESQCPEGAIQVIEVEIEPAKVEPPKAKEAKKKPSKKTKRRLHLKLYAPRRNCPTNAHAATAKGSSI
ncbi:MAG TPA: 4Fe-4S dicluster domain-containing protein [Candidatus Bathyarchaeia archaeon]